MITNSTCRDTTKHYFSHFREEWPPFGGVKFEEEAVMTVLGGAVPTSERRGRSISAATKRNPAALTDTRVEWMNR